MGVRKMTSLKLYRVTLRGRFLEPAYSIAFDAESVYQIVRKSLQSRNIGLPPDRELGKIELLADAVEYPSCGNQLYINHESLPDPT